MIEDCEKYLVYWFVMNDCVFVLWDYFFKVMLSMLLVFILEGVNVIDFLKFVRGCEVFV